jgi:hypothetical protein
MKRLGKAAKVAVECPDTIKTVARDFVGFGHGRPPWLLLLGSQNLASALSWSSRSRPAISLHSPRRNFPWKNQLPLVDFASPEPTCGWRLEHDVSQDRVLACDVQQRFMRGLGRASESVDYSARRRQVRALGGDRYDFIPLTDNRLALVNGCRFALMPVVRYSCTSARCVSRSRYRPTSHRQNDAELCIAAHHARVGLGRFFERIGFNHGTHAG